VAGEDQLARGPNSKRELSAVLFMGGVYLAFDAMSTINSSPWTTETFGTDPKKAESSQWYVRQAIGASLAFGATSSYVGGTPWPFVGTALADAYLFWLYRRAFHLAQSK
jgi:hypothetical protein